MADTKNSSDKDTKETEAAFEAFNFDFDPGIDIFGNDFGEGPGGEEPTSMDDVPGADPGVFLPNTEGRTEFLPPDPDRVPVIEQAVKQDTEEYAARPAIDRTKELFSYMYPHRMALFALLDEAREPRSHEDMEKRVAEIQAHKFSVYTTANLCTMLETAGALETCAEDGGPISQEKPQPKIVVIDGIKYYEPTNPPKVYWKTTEAGLEMLALDDPEERLERQFDMDKDYLSFYKQVLLMCSDEDGATVSEMSAAIDKDPLISQPQRKYFVQHFIEALERCEALSWDGKIWRTRELGAKALEGPLADVDVSRFAEAVKGASGVETETQGINW